MSLAKYNGTCKECGSPIRKGRTDIRVRQGRTGRETVCAYHVAKPQDQPEWIVDAIQEAKGSGDWSLVPQEYRPRS